MEIKDAWSIKAGGFVNLHENPEQNENKKCLAVSFSNSGQTQQIFFDKLVVSGHKFADKMKASNTTICVGESRRQDILF